VTSYSPMEQQAQTLGSLCHWWSKTKEEPLPAICHQFLQVPPDRLEELLSAPYPPRSGDFSPVKHSNLHNRLHEHRDTATQDVNPIATGRSISMVGVLGGVLFILLLVACITCIRQQKRYQEQEGPRDSNLSHHLRYVRQLRASQDLMEQLSYPQQTGDIPPDYSSVVKLGEEGELPSYSQAVAGGSSARGSKASLAREETSQDREDTCQTRGETSQARGETSQIRGETSQIRGDISQIRGETCQVREDTIQIREEMCQIRMETSQTSRTSDEGRESKPRY